jgi:hypothetical protein
MSENSKDRPPTSVSKKDKGLKRRDVLLSGSALVAASTLSSPSVTPADAAPKPARAATPSSVKFSRFRSPSVR